MKFFFGSLFVLQIFFLGCLNASPLFNHENAEDLKKGEAFLGDCEIKFETQDLCATVVWMTTEPTEEEGRPFEILFKNRKTKEPVDPEGLRVAVKLWMPEHGHGSSPVRVGPVLNADGLRVVGKFLATSVFFSMPGNWEVWIQFKNGNSIVEQSKFTHQE